MNDIGLFEATIPVFRHYLNRIEAMLYALSEEDDALLQRKLILHSFVAGEQFEIAQKFVLRTVFPLLGRDIPDLKAQGHDRVGLTVFGREVSARLAKIAATDFNGASGRHIKHTAGEAELEQDATTFVTLFALPNFYFHLTMGYAILRREGVHLGKSVYDGQHIYPLGFHF